MSDDNIVAAAEGFSHYGTNFQEKVVQALIVDHAWAKTISDVINVDYFDKRHLKYLTQRFFEYGNKYKVFPTFNVLVMIARDELKEGHDELLRDAVVEFLVLIKNNPDPGDLKWVKEKALDFCRKQAMKNALLQSVDMIGNGKLDAVIGIMRQAIAAGDGTSIGHDFFVDIDVRMNIAMRRCIATGIAELDAKRVLSGGLGAGELGVVLGGPASGKTHILVYFGAHAVKERKNVVHYTFELSERYVGLRYDSNFCEIPSDEVAENKDRIIETYRDMRHGRLIVKEYPSNSCSVVTIRNHLERLDGKGFRPDLLIVDYADIMRSTRQFDSPRHEIKLIYEELRGLAQELSIPCWTGSQAHRDAATADIIGLENVSEAYSKAMIADFIVSLSRKPLERATGVGRLFIAKNRFGKDGIVFPIVLDTATSRLIVTGEAETSETMNADDEKTLKREIRKKLDKINDDAELAARRLDS